MPLLRGWVRKLRGICTHPQVGQLFRPNDRSIRPGTLKTLGDVLEVRLSCECKPCDFQLIVPFQTMKDESWRTLMNTKKSKVSVNAILRDIFIEISLTRSKLQ